MIALTVVAHCPRCRRPYVLEVLSQRDEVEDGTVTTVEAETYPLLGHLLSVHGEVVDNVTVRDLPS